MGAWCSWHLPPPFWPSPLTDAVSPFSKQFFNHWLNTHVSLNPWQKTAGGDDDDDDDDFDDDDEDDEDDDLGGAGFPTTVEEFAGALEIPPGSNCETHLLHTLGFEITNDTDLTYEGNPGSTLHITHVRFGLSRPRSATLSKLLSPWSLLAGRDARDQRGRDGKPRPTYSTILSTHSSLRCFP